MLDSDTAAKAAGFDFVEGYVSRFGMNALPDQDVRNNHAERKSAILMKISRITIGPKDISAPRSEVALGASRSYFSMLSQQIDSIAVVTYISATSSRRTNVKACLQAFVLVLLLA